MNCALSEERLKELVDVIYDNRGGYSIEEKLRRFFALPDGAVRVEVAVCVSGEERSAMAVDDDRRRAIELARDGIFATDITHECYATLYVPPVPPVPVMEVVQ